LKIVTKHGKHMEGWDEILHPDLPKSSLIQSWRGKKSLAEAARQGYSGILSAGYYLDLMQPAAQHYAVDPLKDADPSKNEVGSLTAEEQRRVLGGEAAMWEEIATMENIDVKLWPRVAAIAERFWSPQDVTDVASMYRRLEATSHWLDLQGLQHLSEIRLMQARLAGSFDPAPLAVLASILEPMKGYSRHRTRLANFGMRWIGLWVPARGIPALTSGVWQGMALPHLTVWQGMALPHSTTFARGSLNGGATRLRSCRCYRATACWRKISTWRMRSRSCVRLGWKHWGRSRMRRGCRRCSRRSKRIRNRRPRC
jgi:hypothetical protein